MPELRLIATDEYRFIRSIDWNLFQLFFEIVHSGGISAAARRINRQQPTISAGLKRLEDHLGVDLCRRTSQGIELTAAGRALLPLCEAMMAAVRAVPHEMVKVSNLVEGRIRIRMISNVVSSAFDDALIAFHHTHPGVEVHVAVAPWRAVVEGLNAGEVDIGIACDSAPSVGLDYVPLMKEVQQLYCGPRHPLHGGSVDRPRELAKEPFVLTGNDEPEELERFRRRFGLGARVGGFAENLHEARRLIELGVGIGFLPTCVAESVDDRSGGLWPLLSNDLLPSYRVYLITHKQSERDTPTELLLAAILRQVEGR